MHTAFLALTGDTALPVRSFTVSAGMSQSAALQMPQYREHSSAGRPWQAAEVAAHLHELMGFYCAVCEQIKKQYLLIWGRTKERSVSETNTTLSMPQWIAALGTAHRLVFLNWLFWIIVIEGLIGCLRVLSDRFTALFQVCVCRGC